MSRIARIFGITLLVSVLCVGMASAEVTIKFWHAMAGERIELLAGMAEEFNSTHEGITVDAQYIGSYNDTLNKTIAAFKAGDAPHVFQLYEIGTRSMIDGGMIIPVGDMAEKENFDWSDYIDVVLSYYTVDGKIYSMPFNSSTPILFYNKSLFEKAGLDPNMPPDTWSQVREMGQKIIDAGVAAGLLHCKKINKKIFCHTAMRMRNLLKGLTKQIGFKELTPNKRIMPALQ